MITFVIFDLDDVLASLDRGKRLRWLSAATGKPPEHFDATIWNSDFEASAEGGMFTTGEQYLEEFNRRSGCSLSREQWIEARRQAMSLIPETLAIAAELQQNARIAVLTNNGSLLKESLPELIPESCALFGGAMHVSSDFQARKPEPLVYQRLLARYGVPSAEALMIDDGLENVLGARAAGLHAIHFQNPAQLREELHGFGLLGGIQ